MASIQEYFQDYSRYHRTQGNQVSHYFGITFILVSLLGLLGKITLGDYQFAVLPFLRIDAGILLLIVGISFYLWLDWKIGFSFSFVLIGLYFLGRAIPTTENWILFISGWILQGIGHAVFEKNSPAFFKNLTHLMIGPMWIFAKLTGLS